MSRLLLALAAVVALVPAASAQTKRYLYVAAPGIRNDLAWGGHGIVVFDMDTTENWASSSNGDGKGYWNATKRRMHANAATMSGTSMPTVPNVRFNIAMCIRNVVLFEVNSLSKPPQSAFACSQPRKAR